MSVVTAHQTDLTTFCKFKREHKLRRALHLLLNPNYATKILSMLRTFYRLLYWPVSVSAIFC